MRIGKRLSILGRDREGLHILRWMRMHYEGKTLVITWWRVPRFKTRIVR